MMDPAKDAPKAAGDLDCTIPLKAWEREDATFKKLPPGLQTGSGGAFFAFCLPDFSQCSPAVSAIGPAIGQSVEGLTGVADWSSTGSVDWAAGPIACWETPVLTIMMCCPCTGLPVGPRTMAAMVGGTCEAACLTGCLTCCLAPCLHANERTRFRTKYNLKGSKGEDCALAYCCGPCLLCQEAREAAHQTNGRFAVPFTEVGDAAALVREAPTKAPAPTEEMKRDIEPAPTPAAPAATM